MDITRKKPCHKRPAHHIDTWASAGFRLEVYGIAQAGDMPDIQLCRAAREIADRADRPHAEYACDGVRTRRPGGTCLYPASGARHSERSEHNAE